MNGKRTIAWALVVAVLVGCSSADQDSPEEGDGEPGSTEDAVTLKEEILKGTVEVPTNLLESVPATANSFGIHDWELYPIYQEAQPPGTAAQPHRKAYDVTTGIIVVGRDVEKKPRAQLIVRVTSNRANLQKAVVESVAVFGGRARPAFVLTVAGPKAATSLGRLDANSAALFKAAGNDLKKASVDLGKIDGQAAVVKGGVIVLGVLGMMYPPTMPLAAQMLWMGGSAAVVLGEGYWFFRELSPPDITDPANGPKNASFPKGALPVAYPPASQKPDGTCTVSPSTKFPADVTCRTTGRLVTGFVKPQCEVACIPKKKPCSQRTNTSAWAFKDEGQFKGDRYRHSCAERPANISKAEAAGYRCMAGQRPMPSPPPSYATALCDWLCCHDE